MGQQGVKGLKPIEEELFEEGEDKTSGVKGKSERTARGHS